jgi:hypothetical protein
MDHHKIDTCPCGSTKGLKPLGGNPKYAYICSSCIAHGEKFRARRLRNYLNPKRRARMISANKREGT